MSEYIVSARKYRPDSFESLIGQDTIAQTLKNSILRGKLAHAYLFCGPRGVGKTSTARIFAKMINCSNPTADMEPCGECESCKSFAEGRSYCIHELDAASNNGVEDIKNLMDQVRIPPQVGRYSVYIIDEVHMLSSAAFNAFLKTLEEPPAHAIFILATTEKHKVLPTILSRCQTYDFNRISVDDIVRNLRKVAAGEGVRIDDESLHVIAHKADGAMRDALTIFDQTVAFCGTDVKYKDVLDNLNVLDYEYSFSLVDAFLKGDHATALLTFDEILAKGFNALHFIAALSSHFRDLIVSRSGGLDALLELPESLKQKYKEQASRCPLAFLYDSLAITTQCESGYRAAVNPRLHIEFALMKLSFQGANVPSDAVKAVPEASVAPAPAPAVKPAPAPAVHAPAAQIAPAHEAAPVAATASLSQDSSASLTRETPESQTASEKPARTRRSRASRSVASGLSLKKVMEEPQTEEAVLQNAPAALPEDEALKAHWPELARMYESKPRLASMLSSTELDIREEDKGKIVTFQVVNEAQKDWVESKLLHELEGNYRKLVGSVSVYLRVDIKPDDEVQSPKIYMPSDQAKELMETNSEVRNLIVDLDLDVR